MEWYVRANDFTQNKIVGETTVCSKKSLMIQAIKKLALFWGAAIVSVFIPVLHFFLVPAFFIAGIFFFFKQFKNTHFIQSATYTCPHCHQQSSLTNFYFNEDTHFGCALCARQLAIIEVETK